MSYTTEEVRDVQTGFQAVQFIGCELTNSGEVDPSTADRIRKVWAPTRRQAKQKLRQGGQA